MSFSIAMNPAITLLLQPTTEILILGFTSPSSILRLAALPLQLTFWYLTFHNLNDYVRANWTQIISALSFSAFFMGYLEMAILRKWSFEVQGPTSQPPNSKTLLQSNNKVHTNGKTAKSSSKIKNTFLNRLKFGWDSTFSIRDINTPHEQANVPLFSSSDPSYIPSKPKFLLQTSIRFIITYLILDLAESLPPPPSVAPFEPSLHPIFLRSKNVPGITSEEVATRIGTSAMVWVVTYSLINSLVAFMSLVFVGTGLTSVSSWRPLFGSFGEAYTLRGFWGKSWHQLLRKPINNPAIWFVENGLGLKKGLVSRYLKIFITFFLSGWIHTLADLSTGLPFATSGALQFFSIQTLGIILEDAMQHLYRKSGGKGSLWTKVVGYVWVVAFLLFWTSPRWLFPAVLASATRSEEEKVAFGRLVPLGVWGWVLGS